MAVAVRAAAVRLDTAIFLTWDMVLVPSLGHSSQNLGNFFNTKVDAHGELCELCVIPAQRRNTG